ncbi:YodC family protein [Leclercia adecarboxylata]|uniref:DUF2158 domain-containing protein n=1 Tax=Leclercia adecarboxylata TaxID=83655 RepID=UPI001F436973|nr:DUF2158 domain-containing protein [Leclercia adecarboxylata]MCE9981455.1 YodC family protein [Leclercia adecarboxylata]
MAFVEGNVVTLKSGDRQMTVLGIAKDMGAAWKHVPGDYVIARWMTDNGDIKTDAFDPDTLSFADPNIKFG